MEVRLIDPSSWRFTAYFQAMHQRADRVRISMEWILRTASEPEYRRTQTDARVRCWRRIPEADNRWLRVILLEDGQTIHNAFFDRGFSP